MRKTAAWTAMGAKTMDGQGAEVKTSCLSCRHGLPGGLDRNKGLEVSYKHTMAKQPISVTLDSDNLTWLKGRVSAAGVRSVSELLDQIVTATRNGGSDRLTRSVVGTIDIDSSDPLLKSADHAVRALFRIRSRQAQKRRG